MEYVSITISRDSWNGTWSWRIWRTDKNIAEGEGVETLEQCMEDIKATMQVSQYIK